MYNLEKPCFIKDKMLTYFVMHNIFLEMIILLVTECTCTNIQLKDQDYQVYSGYITEEELYMMEIKIQTQQDKMPSLNPRVKKHIIITNYTEISTQRN